VRFDVAGVILLTGTMIVINAFFLSLQALPDVNLTRLSVEGAGSLLLAALLIWHERRTTNAIFPRQLFAIPAVQRADLLAAFHGAMLVSLLVFVPILFRIRYGLDSAVIGTAVLPITLGLVLGAPATGQLVTKTGYTMIWAIWGLSACTLIFLLLAVVPRLDAVWTCAMLGMVGLLAGTVMGPVQIVVQISAGTKLLGSAAASVQFSRMLGSSLGIALMSTVMFLHLSAYGPEAFTSFNSLLGGAWSDGPRDLPEGVDRALSGVFYLLALFAGTAAVCAMRVPVRRV
jgi:hypothetical protein